MKTIFICLIASVLTIFVFLQSGLFDQVENPPQLNPIEQPNEIENISTAKTNEAPEKDVTSNEMSLSQQCPTPEYVEIDAPEIEFSEPHLPAEIEQKESISETAQQNNSDTTLQTSVNSSEVNFVAETQPVPKNEITLASNNTNAEPNSDKEPVVIIDTENVASLFRWINRKPDVALYCDSNQNNKLYRYSTGKWTLALQISQQGVLREFISPEMKNAANLPNNCSRLLVVWPYGYWSNITAPILGKDIEFVKIKLSVARLTLYSEVIQSKPKIASNRTKVASL